MSNRPIFEIFKAYLLFISTLAIQLQSRKTATVAKAGTEGLSNHSTNYLPEVLKFRWNLFVSVRNLNFKAVANIDLIYLAMELLPQKYRAFTGVNVQAQFAVGYMILGYALILVVKFHCKKIERLKIKFTLTCSNRWFQCPFLHSSTNLLKMAIGSRSHFKKLQSFWISEK